MKLSVAIHVVSSFIGVWWFDRIISQKYTVGSHKIAPNNHACYQLSHIIHHLCCILEIHTRLFHSHLMSCEIIVRIAWWHCEISNNRSWILFQEHVKISRAWRGYVVSYKTKFDICVGVQKNCITAKWLFVITHILVVHMKWCGTEISFPCFPSLSADSILWLIQYMQLHTLLHIYSKFCEIFIATKSCL